MQGSEEAGSSIPIPVDMNLSSLQCLLPGMEELLLLALSAQFLQKPLGPPSHQQSLPVIL